MYFTDQNKLKHLEYKIEFDNFYNKKKYTNYLSYLTNDNSAKTGGQEL